MSTRKQSDNTVKLFAGASLVIGIILSALGTITGIVDWPQERKIIFGGVLIVGLLSLEFVRWNRKRKRISAKKLPWLLDLIVDVQGELDSESKKVLRDEIILQILKLALVSIIVTIIVAAGINWSEISLGGVMNPPTFTPTPTQTATNTSTATSTFPPSTATSEEQGIFYMFVLDASVTMTESFEAQTKWDAALRAVDSILVGLEDGANYALVAIGGAPGIGSSNPCEEPSLLSVPFSTSKADVGGRVGQLQPGGGGSLYKAFVLAVDELDSLPESTVRSLIYITGSEDACENQDEWAELERFFKIRGDARLDIYSEIIIIDEKNGIRTQTIADRISNLSDKVNVQAPPTIFQLLQSNHTVINNISNYVDITIASLSPVPPIDITVTNTPTQGLGPVIIDPPVVVTSITPTFTPTLTPSITPSRTPSPTVTLFPEVLYITNLGNGQILNCSTAQECIIDVGIQWVPDSQSQGRYLSVWVRPIPEEPDGSGQVYHSQNSPQYQGNGIWNAPSIYIGKIGDYDGMNFAIYVIVTNEYYGAGIPQPYLPSNLSNYSVNVKRGVPP